MFLELGMMTDQRTETIHSTFRAAPHSAADEVQERRRQSELRCIDGIKVWSHHCAHFFAASQAAPSPNPALDAQSEAREATKRPFHVGASLSHGPPLVITAVGAIVDVRAEEKATQAPPSEADDVALGGRGWNQIVMDGHGIRCLRTPHIIDDGIS